MRQAPSPSPFGLPGTLLVYQNLSLPSIEFFFFPGFFGTVARPICLLSLFGTDFPDRGVRRDDPCGLSVPKLPKTTPRFPLSLFPSGEKKFFLHRRTRNHRQHHVAALLFFCCVCSRFCFLQRHIPFLPSSQWWGRLRALTADRRDVLQIGPFSLRDPFCRVRFR